MKKQIAIGSITTERLKNSYMGNPAYRVWFVSEDGSKSVCGRTSSNSTFAYNMPSSDKVEVTWHETKSGNIVFDNIVKA